MPKGSVAVKPVFGNNHSAKIDPTATANPAKTKPAANQLAAKNPKNIENINGKRATPEVQRQKQLRKGYYAYNNRWRDHDFHSTVYIYVPTVTCEISPCYDYAALPGYVDETRITVISPEPVAEPTYDGWTLYHWDQDSFEKNLSAGNPTGQEDNPAIDHILGDLVAAFEKKDFGALGELVGRGKKVDIFMDGFYEYTLASDDVYDMLHDDIDIVKTASYTIDSVKVRGDQLDITATHSYIDPWGDLQSLTHTFRINWSATKSQIVRFGTSDSTP